MTLTKATYSMIDGAPVNVRDYGIVGDGSDETTKLQAAFAALGTGVLLVLNGLTITINDRILVSNKSGFSVDGQGGTIKAKNGMTVAADKELLAFRNCSSFTISNLKIDGNRATRTPAEVSAHNIEFRSCSKFVCEQVISNNAVCDGFIFNTATNTNAATYCLNFQMVNCFADNCYRQGASVINAYDFKFSGGAYTNTNGTAPQAGIDIESNAGATVGNRNGVIENCVFSGNSGCGILLSNVSGAYGFNINSCYFSGNALGALGIYTDDTHVSSCIFEGHSGAGIAQGVVAFQFSGTTKSGSISNCRFSGNTNTTACIYVSAGAENILIDGNLISGHTGNGITTFGPNTHVTNNSIYNCSGLGITPGTQAVNSVVQNNYIIATTTYGLYVSALGCKILSNVCKDIATPTAYMVSEVSGTIFQNNICQSTTAATTTIAISLTGGSTNNVVVNNTFTNLHSTQPIAVSGSVLSQHVIYSNSGGTANDPRKLLSGMGLPFYTTATRPTSIVTGQNIFDTTLGYPVWYNGTNWVNASGATV